MTIPSEFDSLFSPHSSQLRFLSFTDTFVLLVLQLEECMPPNIKHLDVHWRSHAVSDYA